MKAYKLYVLFSLSCVLVTYALIVLAFLEGSTTNYTYTITMNDHNEWLLETALMLLSLPGVVLLSYYVLEKISQ